MFAIMEELRYPVLWDWSGTLGMLTSTSSWMSQVRLGFCSLDQNEDDFPSNKDSGACGQIPMQEAGARPLLCIANQSSYNSMGCC